LAQTFPLINGSYDYLLHIKTIQYTEENVRELLQESKRAKDELVVMRNTSHTSMWENDIKNI
jgi:DNA topoisomerase-2